MAIFNSYVSLPEGNLTINGGFYEAKWVVNHQLSMKTGMLTINNLENMQVWTGKLVGHFGKLIGTHGWV